MILARFSSRQVLTVSTPQPRGPVVRSVLAIAVLALFVRALLQLELQRRTLQPDLASNLSYLVVPTIAIGLLQPLLRANGAFVSRLFAEPTPKRGTRLPWVVRAIAIGVLLRLTYWSAITLAAAYGWHDSALPSAAFAAPQFRCPDIATLSTYVLAMICLAPPLEELLYRGLLLFAIAGYLGQSRWPGAATNMAVILSAGVFAVFHGVDTILIAWLAGIVFGALTLRLRSLRPAIVAHMTYNSLTVLDWVCLRFAWQPTGDEVAIGTTASVVMIATLGGIVRCLKTPVPRSER